VATELTLRRAEAERVIAAHFREVLAVASVGLDDNFFDLGGNSLMAIQLYAKLREVLGVEFSIVDLFKHPSIRSLVDGIFPTEASSVSETSIQERVIRQRQALSETRDAVVRRSIGHAQP
jgi:acyl carrier protein